MKIYPCDILRVFSPVKKNCWKKIDIVQFFSQKIDCGYTLEMPWRGSSNEYPQSMF